jgi:biliverdin reductase
MGSLRVGLVGTGYAAKLRAETFQADSRSQLVAVAGHTPEAAIAFSQVYGAQAAQSWQALVEQPDLDLVVVSSVNRDHAPIVRAALEASKHVVVEYPLALEFTEAKQLVELATAQNKLLHVEHIELLSGLHQAVKTALPAIAVPFYVRYTSLNAQRPAPQKWTYDPELFGFPLVGAVSRIHRLTDLFGQVKTVSCQARFWAEPNSSPLYHSCICTAHLQFLSGLVAEVIYGKGEAIWQAVRTLEVHAEQGAIFLDRDQGTLVQADQTRSLDIGTRRGLFAKDTEMVLNYLTAGTPLYVTLSNSLQALRVADAARRSAETGRTIELSPSDR